MHYLSRRSCSKASTCGRRSARSAGRRKNSTLRLSRDHDTRMKLPDSIAEQVASSDPTAQAVVALLWSMYEQPQVELQAVRELQAMREQSERLRQPRFGR